MGTDFPKVGQPPSPVIPSSGDSAAGVVATTTPSNKIKPGYSDLEKTVVEDLAKVREDCELFQSALLSNAPHNGAKLWDNKELVASRNKFLEDRNKLRADVKAYINASPPDWMVLSPSDAEGIGEIIISRTNDHPDEYPLTFIKDAVEGALQEGWGIPRPKDDE